MAKNNDRGLMSRGNIYIYIYILRLNLGNWKLGFASTSHDVSYKEEIIFGFNNYSVHSFYSFKQFFTSTDNKTISNKMVLI